MDLIAAVYNNWGIGKDGTQPVTLSADRRFFSSMTSGAIVVAGHKTIEDYPGKQPLPGRICAVLTGREGSIPGFLTCSDIFDVLELRSYGRVFVAGGGSVYRQLLPYCDRAFVTKIHADVEADTFLRNLDEDEEWELNDVLYAGEENGISYEICEYLRKPEE